MVHTSTLHSSLYDVFCFLQVAATQETVWHKLLTTTELNEIMGVAIIYVNVRLSSHDRACALFKKGGKRV